MVLNSCKYFNIIGNFFEITYDIKNAARACTRFCKGRMSQKCDAKAARECALHILCSVIGNCERVANVNQEAKLLAMCVRRNALFLSGKRHCVEFIYKRSIWCLFCEKSDYFYRQCQ